MIIKGVISAVMCGDKKNPMIKPVATQITIPLFNLKKITAVLLSMAPDKPDPYRRPARRVRTIRINFPILLKQKNCISLRTHGI